MYSRFFSNLFGRFWLLVALIIFFQFTILFWLHNNQQSHRVSGNSQSLLAPLTASGTKSLRNNHLQNAEMTWPTSTQQLDSPNARSDTAIVVLASRRPEVQQLIRQLMAQKPSTGFQIFVSLDGDEYQTKNVLQRMQSSAVTVLELKDEIESGKNSNDSYARIARHYRRVLDYVFFQLNLPHALLMEDDLLIAPDFYQYFGSLRRALDSDESIFCVSAWNDNGQLDLVTEDPQLLHRTDFFPGLGWMINRRHWLRVRPAWPEEKYDDFLRLYMLENSLVCVRPELSRTFNIGRNGGQHNDSAGTYSSNFYHKYLSRIVLNHENVSLSEAAIDKIIGPSADRQLNKFARSLPEFTLSQILSMPKPPPQARIRYSTAEEFIGIAKRIGAIPEVWFGAPRASIMGITVLSLRKCRVYIVPDKRLPMTHSILGPWLENSNSFLTNF